MLTVLSVAWAARPVLAQPIPSFPEPSQWADVSPPADWQFVPGDFTGDGKVDVMGYHPSNGTLWVGRNSGTSFDLGQTWHPGVSPAAGWKFVAGDFTGDGKVDVMGYYPGNGTLWVGRNTGTSFLTEPWHPGLAPAASWQFIPGDFTGDGKVDLMGYHPSNGTLWVARNTGSSFLTEPWHPGLSPAAGWVFVAGDFAGSGGLDVLGYHPSNNSLWAGQNMGSSFAFAPRGNLEAVPNHPWTIVSGDFVSGGRSDFVAYNSGGRKLKIGSGVGDAFQMSDWPGPLKPPSGWNLMAGNVVGDGMTDLVGYVPCNGTLWTTRNGAAATRHEGYAWPLSAAPGQQLEFRTSGTGSGTVQFQRHRANQCGVESIPMGTTTFTPRTQAVQSNAWRDGAGWAVTFSWQIPSHWPSGIYSARLLNTQGDEHHVTFVVKAVVGQRSGLAVMANVNTWLAYNGWGGKSKYGGSPPATELSFLRPSPNVSPVSPTEGFWHLTRGELWVLGWLEDNGYRPDVYTDVDLQSSPSLLNGYRAVVLSAHPEYWSVEMYDRLKGHLVGGGSLLYLGGNGIFEKGVYSTDLQKMKWMHTAFPLTAPAGTRELFRYDPQRAERRLLGVATDRCDVTGAPYVVEAASHSMLQGTGLANGNQIGQSGLNTLLGGAASGWEVDTVSGVGALAAAPTACGGDYATSRTVHSVAPSGSAFTILATANPGGANLVTYKPSGPGGAPAGGIVLSAGSINFSGSLVVDPKLQTIVRNALTAAGVTP